MPIRETKFLNKSVAELFFKTAGSGVLWIMLIGFLGTCVAQETTNEIMKGITSSFSLPLKDLLKKEHESEWRNLGVGFSGSFSFDYPLSQVKPQNTQGLDTQGIRAQNNMTLCANIKYNPISYWFANITFYKYVDPDLQAPWNPDFSYVIGYDDWHPYTFSFLYSHYGGNHLKPDRSKGEKVTIFEEGGLAFGWKFVIPAYIEKLFIVHSTGGIGTSIQYNLTPRYMNLATLSQESWKQSVGLSIKYSIYKWFYANTTFYYYPIPEQQQPWDPDFTYGFGYFDWHPGTIVVQYNNYSGNRFPWNPPSEGTGQFKNGSISISWSWTW